MSNIFNSKTFTQIPQNWFDLSHNHKTSMSLGRLYPVLVKETLPGDRFVMQTTKFIRSLPMVSPAMHRFTIQEHWFWGPNRTVWDGWEEFITVRQEGVERIHPVMDAYRADRIPIGLPLSQTVGAYMGLPYTGMYGTSSRYVNALPLAHYINIWNNYFRQTQIMDELYCSLIDGLNTTYVDVAWDYAFPCLTVTWERDYFTSALPSPTIGIDVKIPLLDGTISLKDGTTNPNLVLKAGDHTPAWTGNPYILSGQLYTSSSGEPAVIDPNGAWELSQDGLGTIAMLRSAFALQAYLEKEARAGGRYKDVIEAHFPTTLPDYRVQIPEYIGSVKQNLVITEVLSQTENADASLGEMAGHAMSAKTGGKLEYYCPEHGYLFCLVSIVPELVYMNKGLERHWTRELREDYPFPSFANLGEQAILNQELHVGHASPAGTFGYIPRYSEMKYAQSRVSGQMAETLSYWHLAQTLPTNVALNPAFLLISNQSYDLDRLWVTVEGGYPENDQFVCDIWFEIKVRRALPRYGLPMTLGHI